MNFQQNLLMMLMLMLVEHFVHLISNVTYIFATVFLIYEMCVDPNTPVIVIKDFVLLNTLKTSAIMCNWSMFMNNHKSKLTVASQPSYYAIKVNVHEEGRREERTMQSLKRKLLLCHSNECRA